MVRRTPRRRWCTNSSSTAARTSEKPTWKTSDTTAYAVNCLRRLGGAKYERALAAADAYIASMSNDDGGFPTYVRGGTSEIAMTAGAATALAATPHHGELATLLAARGVEVDRATIAAAPEEWASRAAELLACAVLLKGSTTHVAYPGGGGIRVQSGPPWLATAGSGDVLGGVLGALTAARSDEILADPDRIARVAAAAAFLHGRAGERASGGG